MYLSGHILDDYSENIDAVSHVDIVFIKESAPDSDRPEAGDHVLRDKQRLTVVGSVTGRTVKTTRNGDPMAFVKLEDKTGEIELICFSDTLERYGYLLTNNSAVVVRGAVNFREDSDPKIVVNEVSVLETNDRFEKKAVHAEAPRAVAARMRTVFLRIESKDDPVWKRAQAFLSIFPGKAPVIIYDKSCGKYDKEHVLTLDATDFAISELRSILGEENVVLKTTEKSQQNSF